MHLFVKVRRPRLLGTVVAVGVMLGIAGTSEAQLMLNAPPTVTPVAGGLYQWNFTPFLGAGSSLNYGDFFTVYDFDGFVAKSQKPAFFGWSSTTNATGVKWGPTPAGFSVTGIDNPNITNLSWQWILPTLTAGPSGQSLGTFSALSTYGGIKGGTYAQKSHNGAGGIASGLGATFVPDKYGTYVPPPPSNGGSGVNTLGNPIPDTVTPEPSSMALMLGGASVFPVLSLLKRGRAKNARRR